MTNKRIVKDFMLLYNNEKLRAEKIILKALNEFESNTCMKVHSIYVQKKDSNLAKQVQAVKIITHIISSQEL